MQQRESQLYRQISELYSVWKGREHDLAASFIGKLDSVERPGCVKHIGMMYRWLTIGGVQRVVSLLSFLFVEMGYRVTIILETMDEIAYDLPAEVEVVMLPAASGVRSTGSYLERGKRLQEIIDEKGIDVMISHATASDMLLYDLLLCRMCGTYFVAVKHEMFSACMLTRQDTLYMQQTVFRLVDRLVTLGRDERNFWELQGVKAVCIINPTGEYAAPQRRGDSGGYILWMGRLARMKGCLDVVPIMRRVVEYVPDAVMRIYGNEAEGGVLNELRGQIENSHLEKNIEYKGYEPGNVGDIYSNASVFLMTSAVESFSLTIYESKRSGVPLVTYQMPYLEILKSGLGYIAVENDNTDQAAEAIVALLQDNELRKRLSMEARESVSGFGNSQVKKDWKALFTALPTGKAWQQRDYSAEEVKILLETMIYHYHKGLILEKSGGEQAESGLAAVLEHYLNRIMLPPVIYPFGTAGKQVQDILRNQLHIQEAFVVDNLLAQSDPDIRSGDDLKEIDCSKYLFFICCKYSRQHDEVMESLRGIVPEKNIVDLYPC